MTSVDLARNYANRLVLREARGPGDMEDAMRRRGDGDAFADLVVEAEALVAKLKAARAR